MSFVNDIQLMMHGFGDCRKPLHDTAVLIEQIVHQQITSFILQGIGVKPWYELTAPADLLSSGQFKHQPHITSLTVRAEEVKDLRNAKTIGPEDILFLMRKEHLKLQRLINYMGVRDLYQRANSVANGNPSKDLIDATADSELSRKKICINFLQSIDNFGEYDAVCAGTLFDPVKLDRAQRMDSMSLGMSQQRYKEYCDARKASFCPRLRVNKFREWLITDDTTEIKLNQFVLEMLNFLAYETVAQIVDLSLLVKRDADGRPSDLSRYQAPTAVNPDYPSVLIPQGNVMSNGVESASKEINVGMNPITPSEVREAIRRYWANNSPMAPFTKTTSPLHTRLLAG